MDSLNRKSDHRIGKVYPFRVARGNIFLYNVAERRKFLRFCFIGTPIKQKCSETDAKYKGDLKWDLSPFLRLF